MTALAGMLASYRASGERETADLERLRGLAGDPWSRSSPLHVTGSALIVHPPTRRVLLRWHVRLQAWLQVGGHADPGETDPYAVALREAEEETGLTDLTPWPADVPEPVHLVIVPVPASADEPAHQHADLRFVLATGTPDQARPEHPDAPLRWLPIEEAYAAAERPNLAETLRRVALSLPPV